MNLANWQDCFISTLFSTWYQLVNFNATSILEISPIKKLHINSQDVINISHQKAYHAFSYKFTHIYQSDSFQRQQMKKQKNKRIKAKTTTSWLTEMKCFRTKTCTTGNSSDTVVQHDVCVSTYHNLTTCTSSPDFQQTSLCRGYCCSWL